MPVLICTISHNSLCLRSWSNWFPALPIGVVGIFFFFDRTSLVPARSEMAWRVKPSITRCDTLQPFLMEWWSYLVRIWSKLYYWGPSGPKPSCLYRPPCTTMIEWLRLGTFFASFYLLAFGRMGTWKSGFGYQQPGFQVPSKPTFSRMLNYSNRAATWNSLEWRMLLYFCTFVDNFTILGYRVK